LIETLAQDLIGEIGAQYPLERIKITVEKPGALPNAECAFVEMEEESLCLGH
jgi:dihydroneopterin aldolase